MKEGLFPFYQTLSNYTLSECKQQYFISRVISSFDQTLVNIIFYLFTPDFNSFFVDSINAIFIGVIIIIIIIHYYEIFV